MVLLKAGADTQAADKLGRRALDIAEDSGHTKLGDFLRQWQPQPTAAAAAASPPPPVQPPQGSATAAAAASGLRRAPYLPTTCISGQREASLFF